MDNTTRQRIKAMEMEAIVQARHYAGVGASILKRYHEGRRDALREVLQMTEPGKKSLIQNEGLEVIEGCGGPCKRKGGPS